MKKKKYTQLTIEERDKIAVLHASGLSLSAIGLALGRNKSSISRELRRNRAPIYKIYLADKAHERALKRKREAAWRPRLKNDIIKRYVINKIKRGWSPEQISGCPPIKHPRLNISYEAIYQFIYHPETGKELNLVPYLARSHRKPKRCGQGKKHKKSHIPNRISIEQRPKHIEYRKQPGHWEADTLVSRQSKVALVIIVEPNSRFVKIGKLDQ